MDRSEASARLAALSPAKLALLKRRAAGDATGAAPVAARIPRRADPAHRPLSFSQQRLWVLDQLDPGSAAYNEVVPVRLRGPLDADVLGRCLEEIAARHEVLRTTIGALDGQPVQQVAPTLVFALRAEPLEHLDAEAREERVRRAIRAAGELPFDLGTEPLMRARLLRTGHQEHVLVLTLHHLVTDGWSPGILFRELAALYPAFAEGRPSPLAPLALQYADFAAWQREWLSGDELRRQVDYWARHLRGAPALLELPTDRPRPPVQGSGGRQVKFLLGRDLLEALQALSRREGVSLYMTLLAAFYALLGRWSGQDDVVVGTPVAGRGREELEELIGFFVNTLALRADLSGDPTFLELLARVRDTALNAFAHEQLPFEKVVEELQPERTMAYNPVFQAMFTFQNVPEGGGAPAGLALEPMEREATTSKFDLALTMGEAAGGLAAELEYATELWDHETAERMAGHFRRFLEEVARDPGRRVSCMPILSAAERARVLEEPNRTEATFPPSATVHGLFAEEARRAPNAPAAVDAEGRGLTYGELDERSNRLAHHLRGLGVGPEVRVGICVDRSPEMYVAIMGVLKAGGAYVPLDPAYPEDRLAYMLEDAAAPVLITSGDAGGALPPHTARVVRLDDDWAAIAAEPAHPLPELGTPDRAAYVIYTSGSTGKPKGAVISHRSFANAALAWRDAYRLREECRSHLQMASFSFDVFGGDMARALCSGAKLVVCPRDLLVSPEGLCSLMRSQEVDAAEFVPVVLRGLVQHLQEVSGSLRRMRLLVAGSDAWYANEYEEIRRMCGPHTRVINSYGVTEATVDTTFFESGEAAAGAGLVPIGRPFANQKVYVLSPGLEPVPLGVAGDLYLAGAGLARGYLNQPGMTAERFIPDPFGGRGARMYRSGDRARWRADGNLEFLGRGDHQVKIRGFRVELGEVESAIADHPGVAQGVVVAREDQPGRKRLVAYVVPAEGCALDPAELREHLRGLLPDYMVPAAFVGLERLPLTPNGKIDRKALPAPDASGAPEESFVAARDHVEAGLAAVWAAALGVERVGVHDNFFELGGDSILSIQVVSRAAQAGVRITARQLFQHQTVAELAAVAGTVSSLRAEQGEVSGSLPLTPIQRWFFAQEVAQPHHYNQSMLLEVRERLAPAVVQDAVAALLAHHDALRMRFARTGEGWAQVNAPAGGPVPFEAVDLSYLHGDDLDDAVERACALRQAELALDDGPLLRALLVDRGAAHTQRLFVCAHHLVVDGVSWRVLLEDLETACRQLARGEAPRLPLKTTSFREWAAKLAAHAGSGALRDEVELWADGGAPPPLPVDHAGGGNTVASAATVQVALDEEETRALLTDVPPVYGTQVNDVLLAALARAFAPWTGSGTLLLELEGHGREDLFDDADVSRTVGWFTSAFPVEVEVDPAAGPGEALRAVKEQLRRLPGRGIGWGLLRWMGDEATRERLAARPSPEVSFNYFGQFDGSFSGEALFAAAAEGSGEPLSPAGRRPHLIEINGGVTGGRLRMAFTYSRHVHEAATVQRLADAYVHELRAIVEHCRAPEAGGYTPSDFPHLALDQDGLDDLLAELI